MTSLSVVQRPARSPSRDSDRPASMRAQLSAGNPVQ